MVPYQWLVLKTIPVVKNKSENKLIENYCLIAILCSASKIYEKLILKQILDIKEQNNCEITSIFQHGFKKGRSTTKISLTLQSLIARTLDDEKVILMSSLELSSVLNSVNIKLLLKRLRIVGLPNNGIELIEVWLRKIL
jgi:hypothetical protein